MSVTESIINHSSEILQKLRLQRLLHISITIEVVLTIIAIQRLYLGHLNEVYFILVAMVLFSSMFIFIRRGKYYLGTIVLITLATVVVTFFMWWFSGLQDEVILFYPVVLIFAVILGNEKFSFAMLLFMVANILLLAYLNAEGIYISKPPIIGIETGILISIILALTSYSVWLLSTDLRNALIKIEQENTRVLESQAEIQKLLDNEKKLRETEIELHKLQKIENIGVLAGGIAHDFNNLLTSVYGNLSLARMKLDKDHPIQKYLETSESSINRATQLTKQLLTFSKGGEPVMEAVNLTSLIQETVLFDLSGSNVKPDFHFSKDELEVSVDKGQIQQVISNLIINADQASPDGGTIHINVQNVSLDNYEVLNLSAGFYIKVTIEDEGEGIDKRNLDNIFDPYFTTKSTGNGLGLSVVYSIIKKHNGIITLDTELGKGTCFTFYLPTNRVQPVKQTPVAEVNKTTASQNSKILIMDDDESLLSLMTATLEHHNYRAVTASDGAELLKLYSGALETENTFDAVVMDLTIPGGMGGRETMAELLKMDPNAKCLVSSGYAEDAVMSNFKDYGFKASISKPFVLDEFISVLTTVISEA